jgi:hypothetical protein
VPGPFASRDAKDVRRRPLEDATPNGELKLTATELASVRLCAGEQAELARRDREELMHALLPGSVGKRRDSRRPV